MSFQHYLLVIKAFFRLHFVMGKEDRKKRELHYLGKEMIEEGEHTCVWYERKEDKPKFALLFGSKEKWKEREDF